jgi:hypothetical protein
LHGYDITENDTLEIQIAQIYDVSFYLSAYGRKYEI